MVPGGAAVMFSSRITGAFKAIGAPSTLFAMVALSLYLTLIGYLSGVRALVLYLGGYWSYMLFLIRTSGDGRERMGVPDFRSVSDDLVMPAVKGVLSTWIVWLFPMVYAFAAKGVGFWDLFDTQTYAEPIYFIAVAMGLIYAPMALVAAATEVGVLGILNPLRIFVYIYRVGRDYALVLLTLLGLLVLDVSLSRAGEAFNRAVPIPFFPRWLAQFVGLGPDFVGAFVLGQVLFVHGHLLDWGDEGTYMTPALPGVEPRGEKPEKMQPASAPLVAVRPASLPTMLPFMDEAVQEGAAPSAPLWPEMQESAEIPLSNRVATGPTGPVLAALANKDTGMALQLFRTDPDRLAALLPPSAVFTLGALLARERQTSLAIGTLKKIAYINDPLAARALFLLARLYTDVRKDYDAAETHLRTLLRKFPQSSEAAGAEQMLHKLGYR
ncbi:MAG: hypothetical protein SF187_30195 [Deltaproteobacteria bacterium]|nr:hypothetical protein [Deltaproteobacteria bacterium]